MSKHQKLRAANRSVKPGTTKITDLDENKAYTTEEIKHLIKELKTYRAALDQASARPIRLPSELTVGEYNSIVGFMKQQYERLKSANPDVPGVIADKSGNVTVMERQEG